LVFTRSAIWIWRQYGGGQMAAWQLHLVLIGTAITALSVLWLVRVLSRAHFGDWPWIAAACAVLVYIALNTLDQS
jgi:hypothetical protein